MEKVKFKRIPFKLAGPVALENKVLNFKAVDQDETDQQISNYPGLKVISVVPKLNTKTCDLQTQRMSELVDKYPQVKFITITRDDPQIIKAWLAKHAVTNLTALSDAKHGEFALLTNLTVPKLKILARTVLVLNAENKVIFNAVSKEQADEPDYESLTTFLDQELAV